MSAAHDPTATPASAPASESTIPIEATPPPPASTPVQQEIPERFTARCAGLDAALVAGVLLLAFFLASFAAHNSDLWMHLATGRLVAAGEFPFGADPFASTTGGARWVNNAWLADWIFYLLATLAGGADTVAGGAVLVLTKALLIVALAWLMLQTGRRGQGLLVPAVATALALLAMSPRLLLQSTCISYLFLGLTLYLLQRPYPAVAPGEWGGRRLFLLPVLFVLWVNLDSWFLLGPATVGLFLLGEVLQEKLAPGTRGPEAPTLGTLAVVFSASVLACLINPYHVHVLALPPELAVALSSSPLRGEADFRSFFLSPLSRDYVTNAALGGSVAGVAYYVLVLLGIGTFVLNRASGRWWRLLIWVTFFVLSAFLARAVPFFAVVAGPITALNLQDAVAPLGERKLKDRWQQWALAGRTLALFLLVVMLLLAWPGWLHPYPDDARRSRRVGWSVTVDPSLRQTAEKLRDLRARGALRSDAVGLNLQFDIAPYCAWFCPEEKCFFDYRLGLFDRETTEAYLDMRRALNPRPQTPEEKLEPNFPAADWRTRFRDTRHPIDHLIVCVQDSERSRRVLYQLWGDPDQWVTLYLDGRTAILGWRDPQAPPSAALLAQRFNPNPMAFGPDLPAEARAPRAAAEPPMPRGFWDQYARRQPPHPLATDEAAMFLEFDAISHMQRLNRNQRAGACAVMVERFLTGWAQAPVVAPAGGGLVATLVRTYLGPFPQMQMLASRDLASAGMPLLAVRAARRGVVANPEDAEAYLTLARAFLSLWKYQRERFQGQVRTLEEIRQVQVVTALQRALTLKPDLAEAHQQLADAYYQMNAGTYLQMNLGDPRTLTHLDLAVEHHSDWLKLARAAGADADEAPDKFAERMTQTGKLLERQEQELRKRRTEYELQAANKPPLAKARLALQQGLARKALEVLDTDAANLTSEEAKQLMYLMIKTGRGPEVQDAGIETNDWFNVLVSAATGDYARADEHLAQTARASERLRTQHLLQILRIHTTHSFSPESLSDMSRLVLSLQEWGDLRVLRGLLALEQGDTAAAAEHFRHALRLRFPTGQLEGLVAVFAARSIVEELVLMACPYTDKGFQFEFAPLAARYLGMLEAAARR